MRHFYLITRRRARTRRVLAAGAVVLIVVLIVRAVAFTSVNRPSYIAANNALLRSLPRYPGSHLASIDEQARKASEWTGSPTIGYMTVQTLSLRREATRTAIVEFYETALKGSWQVTAVYPAAGQVNFRQRDAYLEVTASPAGIDVELDHDFY
jgi:hypothetical protein